MHTQLWYGMSYDQLMLLALAGGGIARLCDKQARSLRQSAKQLFFSLATGAAFSVLFVAATTFVVPVQASVAFFLTLFASVLVEVMERKFHELAETHLIEWLKVVIQTALSELKDYLPSSKKPETK